ncbi:MAG TPA: DUF6569 family protein [Myxococcota bacterium]|nr:DUF6569 family protein [Myxococcota bacterium]
MNTAQIDDRLVIPTVIQHGGFAVFPIVDTKATKRPKGKYLTLDEALQTEILEVKEVDESGSVPTLLVHNKGKHPVLLFVGDVVTGGKQDRVITEDLVLEPTEEPVSVAVNCVEQGRWSGATGIHFGYGGKAEADLIRALGEKNQGTTWSKVAELNAQKAVATGAPGLAPASGTYRASLENEAVDEQITAARKVIDTELDEIDGVVGLVLALDGEVDSAELYAHPNLFDKAQVGLVDSYAREALGRDLFEKRTNPPTATEAATFVREAREAKVVEEEAKASSVSRRLDSLESEAFVLSADDGTVVRERMHKKKKK